MHKITVSATKKESLAKNSKCKDYAGVSKNFAAKHGLSRNQHIRIDSRPYATYFRIRDIYEDSGPFIVHEQSLDRFEGSDGDEIELSTTIPQADTQTEAQEDGGVHEVLKDDGDQAHVAVIAPHGGAVEEGTGKLADNCYNMLEEEGVPASLWKLEGYRHPEQDISSFRVWHFSKIMRSPESYPQLQQIVDRDFEYVVGFHRSGYSHVEVGGKADEDIRNEIGSEFRERTGREVRTDTSNMKLPGTAEIISENYLSDSDKQAIHIEATPGVCTKKQKSGARSVVEVLKSLVNN